MGTRCQGLVPRLVSYTQQLDSGLTQLLYLESHGLLDPFPTGAPEKHCTHARLAIGL